MVPANAAHTTRRTLFAIGAATALIPTAALAVSPRRPDWAAFELGLTVLDPRMSGPVRAARAAGFEPVDCRTVFRDGKGGFLVFGRTGEATSIFAFPD